MSYDQSSSKIKSIDEADKTPQSRYDRWKTEIDLAEKEVDNFRRVGRNVVRRYRDERDAVDATQRKFNIFTANVGIM